MFKIDEDVAKKSGLIKNMIEGKIFFFKLANS